MTDFHDKYEKDMKAVTQAESNPTAFVNFVITGDTEGLSEAEVQYLEAVRDAYSAAAEEALRTVKAELEEGAD